MGISRDSAHKRRLTGGRRKPIRKKRKFEMGRQPSHTKVGETSVHKVRVRGGNFKYRALRLDHGNFTWIGEAVSCKARIMKVVYNATSNELIRTNTLVKSCIVQIDATPFKVWYKKFYGHLPGEKEKKDQPLTKKAEKAKKAKAEATKDKKDDKKKLRKSTTTLKQYKKMLLKVKAATKEQKLAAIKEAREAKKKAGGKKDAKKTDATKKAVKKPTDGKKWEKPKKPPTANPESKSHKEKIAKRNKNHHLEGSLEELLRTGKFYARITSRPGQVGRADGIILEGEELAFYQRKMKK